MTGPLPRDGGYPQTYRTLLRRGEPDWEELAASDEGDHDVGGVTIEVLASPVVHGGRSGVGVAGGHLDFSEWDAGVEGGHDERRSQHVGMYQTELCPLADRSHPAVRGAPIQALPVLAHQDGTVSAFPDGKVDGAGRVSSPAENDH
jgi:hypothetical protein